MNPMIGYHPRKQYRRPRTRAGRTYEAARRLVLAHTAWTWQDTRHCLVTAAIALTAILSLFQLWLWRS
ncbi:hypothetical protein SEA_CHEWYVIII_89 [Rhodococcus phage ChewyVIII]|uniref:Uncharacterized protein n=1 Tax=Rhodococcus phage ChewyVIII TaxID=1887657 RepID=A0A1C9EIB3_9CAUD|nr:hypothetical protein QEH30_gp89 [Rhodococcus phage ChewyVIII]AON97517.1 hypothetical protein SEA_CHEWYVIII_89 [Rhodococcus phage ChewyVIII]